jgi:hypothetical protein
MKIPQNVIGVLCESSVEIPMSGTKAKTPFTENDPHIGGPLHIRPVPGEEGQIPKSKITNNLQPFLNILQEGQREAFSYTGRYEAGGSSGSTGLTSGG